MWNTIIALMFFIIVVLSIGLWINHKNRKYWIAEQTSDGGYYLILTYDEKEEHYGLQKNKCEVIKVVEQNKNGYEIKFIDYLNKKK